MKPATAFPASLMVIIGISFLIPGFPVAAQNTELSLRQEVARR